jgi:hypothetical protein
MWTQFRYSVSHIKTLKTHLMYIIYLADPEKKFRHVRSLSFGGPPAIYETFTTFLRF